MAKSKPVAWSIETWPIARPVPYSNNARIIPDSAVDKVAASIKEFGWRQPIVVDEHDVIIAGHTRLRAARKLGLTEVPVRIAIGLSQDKVDAYRLMDNRSNQETSWDNDMVVDELMTLRSEGYDLQMTGFEASEVSTLLGPLSSEDGVGDLLKAKTPSEPDHSSKKSDPGKKSQILCPKCGNHFLEA